MSRWLTGPLRNAMLSVALATVAAPAQTPPAPPKPQPAVQEEVPPEEDALAKPKEYSFNPLQAVHELKIGDYYYKKGKYRAAAERYSEASKWNPTLPEAFFKLGEASEKQHDKKAAKEAYGHYLEMAPDAKESKEVKKKLSKL